MVSWLVHQWAGLKAPPLESSMAVEMVPELVNCWAVSSVPQMA
jgi:hypothetical protein